MVFFALGAAVSAEGCGRAASQAEGIGGAKVWTGGTNSWRWVWCCSESLSFLYQAPKKSYLQFMEPGEQRVTATSLLLMAEWMRVGPHTLRLVCTLSTYQSMISVSLSIW